MIMDVKRLLVYIYQIIIIYRSKEQGYNYIYLLYTYIYIYIYIYIYKKISTIIQHRTRNLNHIYNTKYGIYSIRAKR